MQKLFNCPDFRKMLEEMKRLAGNPGLTRLFFDFWMAGARDRSLRTRIRRALWAYRRSFAPLVDDMFASEPERFGQVTPSGQRICAMKVTQVLASAKNLIAS